MRFLYEAYAPVNRGVLQAGMGRRCGEIAFFWFDYDLIIKYMSFCRCEAGHAVECGEGGEDVASLLVKPRRHYCTS